MNTDPIPSLEEVLAWALARRHGSLDAAEALRLDAALAARPDFAAAVRDQEQLLVGLAGARLPLTPEFRARLERHAEALAAPAEPVAVASREGVFQQLRSLLLAPMAGRSRGTVLLARAFALWLGIAAALGGAALLKMTDRPDASPVVAEERLPADPTSSDR